MNKTLESNDAVHELIRTYSDSLLHLAYAYVKNHYDAEDIVQEVFITYLQKMPHFAVQAQKKAWLMRVTSNRCKDLLKSSWNKRTTQMPDDLSDLPHEQSALLMYVFNLDEKYRIPIHLHYYEGYSIKQIAALMGEKQATIGTWLSRGRTLLKSMIGDDWNEG